MEFVKFRTNWNTCSNNKIFLVETLLGKEREVLKTYSFWQAAKNSFILICNENILICSELSLETRVPEFLFLRDVTF